MLNPASCRDAAVLALHRAELDDGEISRLDWSHVTLGSARILIEAVSRRPGWPEREVVISKDGKNRSAYDALAAWRRVATTCPEPVFTPVDVSGWRDNRPLTARAIFRIRKSRLTSLGPPELRTSVDQAMALLSSPPSEVIRDKALLLLGFAGAFRRGEVTRLTWGEGLPVASTLSVEGEYLDAVTRDAAFFATRRHGKPPPEILHSEKISLNWSPLKHRWVAACGDHEILAATWSEAIQSMLDQITTDQG